MTHEKGKWYNLGEGDNPTIRRRKIEGKYYSRDGIFTNKKEAEERAKLLRKFYTNSNIRIIPLVLWGKIFGYPDSIPSKKQCFVIFRHYKN